MVEVHASLEPCVVDRLRALLDAAFAGAFSDEDWQHALGGHHALVWAEGRLVGHASVVPRRLWVGERMVQAAYVEAVAVLPGHQGRGLGTAAMRALEPVLDTSELGVLSTGQHHFYGRLGWERWRGSTWVREPGGDRRTPDEDDGIMVRRTSRTGSLDLGVALICEPRSGDDW